MDRVRRRARTAPACRRAADGQLLRLRHDPAAVRRRAGATRLRARARPRAARPAGRGRFVAAAAPTLVPPAIWPDGFAPAIEADPDEARRLLDEAGYADRSDLGTIVVNGSGLGVEPGGGGVARGARRRHRDRDDGLRRLPRGCSSMRRRTSSPSAGSRTTRRRTRSTACSSSRARRATTATGAMPSSSSCSRRPRRPPSDEVGRGLRRRRGTGREQAPVIPWAYGETWWLVARRAARARQPDDRPHRLRAGVMGRLTRWMAAAGAGRGHRRWSGAEPVAAFDGFGSQSADSTYGEEMRFEVELEGGVARAPRAPAPHARAATAHSSSRSTPGRRPATYVWDTSIDYVTPNTLVTYQWRAIDGGRVTCSPPRARSATRTTGRASTGRARSSARRRCTGTAAPRRRRVASASSPRWASTQAEELLGTELAGPVDVFVYDTREDFFGALGPGAREWTGAAAYSEIRTIFMWLGGGSAGVPRAGDGPRGDPHRLPRRHRQPVPRAGALAERGHRDLVRERQRRRRSARSSRPRPRGGGLFAFEAITEQFPIGERGAVLSYAQGTTHGRPHRRSIRPRGDRRDHGRATATARRTPRRWRRAPSMPADELYADFYDEFGVEAPTPIAAEPIAASNVDRPDAGEIDPGGVDPGPAQPPGEAAPAEPEASGPTSRSIVRHWARCWQVVGVLAIAISRRAERRAVVTARGRGLAPPQQRADVGDQHRRRPSPSSASSARPSGTARSAGRSSSPRRSASSSPRPSRRSESRSGCAPRSRRPRRACWRSRRPAPARRRSAIG